MLQFNESSWQLSSKAAANLDFMLMLASLDLPDMRFHDLRHSYAVAAIRSGDDIKTVQSNLGHSDATTTLNIYAHVTDQMNRASAERMQGFIKNTVKNA